MPHFMIQYLPGTGPSLRSRTPEYEAAQKARADYRRALGARIVLAGPLFRPGRGEEAVSSLVILDARDQEEAQKLSREDPYFKAGEFSDIVVHELRISSFNPPVF